MQIEDLYPYYVTDRVVECRAFYENAFGFTTVFAAEWIVVLASQGPRPFTLAFMRPEHPTTPPDPAPFDGSGGFLTLQVADARAAWQAVRERGVTAALELRDEPWGQRRFGVVDPAGIWVDVVQVIEPEPGWLERHAA